MPENNIYLPEGLRPRCALSVPALKTAMEEKTLLEGLVLRCGADLSLQVALGSCTGRIPRAEALAPWISGSSREIALLSRVGRQVSFLVTAVAADEKGAALVTLSRRAAQEAAAEYFFSHLQPGAVLTARVTHMEPFGAFLDVGCGIIAMLPVEQISVARISHPAQRFHVGQKILAAVAAVDGVSRRLTMTHKELLGTWMDNASQFQPGETVPGIVRAVREYGCFVELTPNLSGLAERREDVAEGDRVSVYLKSIRPERMKIKLQIIDRLPPEESPGALSYTVTDGPLEHWIYSPPNYERQAVETIFRPTPPTEA